MKKYIYIIFSCIVYFTINSCSSQQLFLDQVYYPGVSNIDPMVRRSETHVTRYTVNGKEFRSIETANDYAKNERRFKALSEQIDSLKLEIDALKEAKSGNVVKANESKPTYFGGGYSSYSSYRPKTVSVRSYTRVQNGKVVHVKAHTRSAPRRR